MIGPSVGPKNLIRAVSYDNSNADDSNAYGVTA